MDIKSITATGWLIFANAIIFVLVLATGLPEPYTSLPADPAQALRHPWTPVSYMLVHYSFWHLLMNMLWLWLFGRVLENVWPERRVVRLYLLGGLAGAIFYIMASLWLSHAGYLCGASAAVVAVMTAAGLRCPNMEVRLMLIGTVRLKWIVAAGVLLLFVGAGGAGFWAHLGGLVAGASLALVRPRHRPYPNAPPPAHRPSRRRARQLGRELELRRLQGQRLDQLLDRVRLSGFDSLSPAEQAELKRISDGLKNEN